MSSFEPIQGADDPRVTTWALGERDELSAEECSAIEAMVEKDADCSRVVAELKALSGTLTSELAKEPMAELLPAQREAIQTATSRSARPKLPFVRYVLGGALAAGLIGLVASPFLTGVGEEPEHLASLSERRSTREAVSPPVTAADLGPALEAIGYTGTTVESSAGYVAGTPAKVEALKSVGYAKRPAPSTDTVALGGLQDGLQTLGYADRSTVGAVDSYHRKPLERSESKEHRRLDRFLGDEDQLSSLDERIANNTEAYDHIVENEFESTRNDSLSTFSIDVDTASYSNMRRFLNRGQFPPKDAIRIEELVNYFSYTYPQPIDAHPFSVNAEVAECPWEPTHRLVQIGLKGREFSNGADRGRNFVFLLDVSGSMNSENKLPLVKDSLRMLLTTMTKRDHVAICVYAGASGLVLPSTPASDSATILGALERLKAGGSTNGGEGIHLAYRVAKQNFIDGGINRVLLATDGDFNVGTTDRGSLVRLIEGEAKSGVFLTVLGFGMGNLKDSAMEQLADKGNGNYAYIDTLNEAKKVLVHEANSTLETIAKDVKIQIEFNPAEVGAYRLIGYENRVLAHTDFNDDSKDAGEIGAGHTVTAIYELIPAGIDGPIADVDPLKYQQPPPRLSPAASNGELLTVKLRYKEPDGKTSKLIEKAVRDGGNSWAQSTADFRFAAAVASFGMLLRDSKFKGSATFRAAIELATEGAEVDPFGYRLEFLQLARKALELTSATRR